MERFNNNNNKKNEKIDSYFGVLSNVGIDYSKALYESLIDEIIDNEENENINYEKILFEEEWEEIFSIYHKYNVAYPKTSVQDLWDIVVKTNYKEKREDLKKIDLFIQKYNYLILYMIEDEISKKNKRHLDALKMLQYLQDRVKKLEEKSKKIIKEKIQKGEYFKEIIKQENKKNKK